MYSAAGHAGVGEVRAQDQRGGRFGRQEDQGSAGHEIRQEARIPRQGREPGVRGEGEFTVRHKMGVFVRLEPVADRAHFDGLIGAGQGHEGRGFGLGGEHALGPEFHLHEGHALGRRVSVYLPGFPHPVEPGGDDLVGGLHPGEGLGLRAVRRGEDVGREVPVGKIIVPELEAAGFGLRRQGVSQKTAAGRSQARKGLGLVRLQEVRDALDAFHGHEPRGVRHEVQVVPEPADAVGHGQFLISHQLRGEEVLPLHVEHQPAQAFGGLGRAPIVQPGGRVDGPAHGPVLPDQVEHLGVAGRRRAGAGRQAGRQQAKDGQKRDQHFSRGMRDHEHGDSNEGMVPCGGKFHLGHDRNTIHPWQKNEKHQPCMGKIDGRGKG